ncbi:MAG: hypothetical protein P8J20_04750 [Novosphingobium sp.]|nr:hypothetical protein [Novosphingobium sp.]
MDRFRIGRTIARAVAMAKGSIASVGIFLLIIQAISVGFSMLAEPRLLATTEVAGASQGQMSEWEIFLSPWYWASIIVPLMLAALCFAGSFRGLLQTARHETAALGECFSSGFANFVPMLALTLLWYLGIVFGMILLIIPGLVLLAMWSVTAPALVGENLNAIASFDRSRQLTQGSRLKILFLLLLFLGVVYGLLLALLLAAFNTDLTALFTLNANPSYQLAMIPAGWIISFMLNALLTSIYLETLLVKESGQSDELAHVFD